MVRCGDGPEFGASEPPGRTQPHGAPRGWQQRSRQGVQIVTVVEIEAGQFRGEALVDPEFRIGIEGEYLVPGERNVQHTSAHAVVRVRELVELRIVIFAVPGQTAAKFQASVEKAPANRPVDRILRYRLSQQEAGEKDRKSTRLNSSH